MTHADNRQMRTHAHARVLPLLLLLSAGCQDSPLARRPCRLGIYSKALYACQMKTENPNKMLSSINSPQNSVLGSACPGTTALLCQRRMRPADRTKKTNHSKSPGHYRRLFQSRLSTIRRETIGYSKAEIHKQKYYPANSDFLAKLPVL